MICDECGDSGCVEYTQVQFPSGSEELKLCVDCWDEYRDAEFVEEVETIDC